MTPWLIYASITLFIGLLFGWLLWRQNKASQKKWLFNKIKTDPVRKDDYINALNKLDQQQTHSSKTTVWLLLALIPATLLLNTYLFPKQTQQSQQPPSLEEALTQLEQSLQKNPNDLEGQMLYGSAMMRLQNFELAVQAFKKANELSPNNANILTELAEAVAFKNNTGSFLGEPQTYIHQALAADPNHQKALWLQGIIAYEQQDYIQAENVWTVLIQKISDDQVKATIIKQINQARSQQNKSPLNTTDLIPGKGSTQSDSDTPIYRIVIDADVVIKNQKFPATTRVFVSAKSPNGPPMPVAAIDLAPPFTWPLNVKLSNQHNLTSQRQLSDFEQLIFSARLSVSGDAGVSDYRSEEVLLTADNNRANLKLNGQ